MLDVDTVTFLHPIGLDSSWWMPYQERLESRYRVLSLDLPGHGVNVNPAPTSIEGIGNDILAQWAELGVTRSSLVGASLGGMVAQWIAAESDVVDSLVLISTNHYLPLGARPAIQQRVREVRESGITDSIIEQTVSRWFPEKSNAQVEKRAHDSLANCEASTFANNWEAISTLDLREELSQVRCPTLILLGDADLSVSMESAQEMNGLIAHADMTVLPRAGHMVAFDQVDACIPLIESFLEGSLAQNA